MDIHETLCLRSVSIKACSVYHIPTYFDLASSKCMQVRSHLFINHTLICTLGVLILIDWINISWLMMLQCKIGIGELCEELLINSSFYLEHTVLTTTLHNCMLVHVACLQACVCFCSAQNIGSLAVCMHCFYHDLDPCASYTLFQ